MPLKSLDGATNDMFDDFGKMSYTKEFWERVAKQENKQRERAVKEEKLMRPTEESMKRKFDI